MLLSLKRDFKRCLFSYFKLVPKKFEINKGCFFNNVILDNCSSMCFSFHENWLKFNIIKKESYHIFSVLELYISELTNLCILILVLAANCAREQYSELYLLIKFLNQGFRTCFWTICNYLLWFGILFLVHDFETFCIAGCYSYSTFKSAGTFSILVLEDCCFTIFSSHSLNVNVCYTSRSSFRTHSFQISPKCPDRLINHGSFHLLYIWFSSFWWLTWLAVSFIMS